MDAPLQAIAAELQELDLRVHRALAEDLGPMAEAMEHILGAGGKRLRPALVILSARLGRAEPEHVYLAAMGIELIHTATLIHDDLIDDSETRRRLASVHALLGANPAIIVGDYCFGKGACLLSAIGTTLVTQVISATVMTLCIGELLQITSRRSYDQPLEEYYRRIDCRTASMLGACCRCGALVAGLDEAGRGALESFGRDLGMAFQIADDLLDYTATEGPSGADLRRGTVTLPLMYALRDPDVGPALRALLAGDALSDADCDEVVAMVRRSAAVSEAERRACEFADRARTRLSIFDPSEARSTLDSLCGCVTGRPR